MTKLGIIGRHSEPVVLHQLSWISGISITTLYIDLIFFPGEREVLMGKGRLQNRICSLGWPGGAIMIDIAPHCSNLVI